MFPVRNIRGFGELEATVCSRTGTYLKHASDTAGENRLRRSISVAPLDSAIANCNTVIRGELAVTIASCYLSPEGVVLGADSTSTYPGAKGQQQYYNHAQKIFELGENSTLAVVTWGLGGLAVSSHRMLLALLADSLQDKPAKDASEVAQRWSDQFGAAYVASALKPEIDAAQALAKKGAFDPKNPGTAGNRTPQEELELQKTVQRLTAGFCIAGYVLPDRMPRAYEVIFTPLDTNPKPAALAAHARRFWGVPNLIDRLINGCDADLKQAILASGKWSGTQAELDDLVRKFALSHPAVPIRDAIDFTHACLFSTVKAIKFSSLPHVCGGPIEVAVITADRRFRWVKHKTWDMAISDGGI